MKVGVSCEPKEKRIAPTGGIFGHIGESPETRQEGLGWYAGITADMFG